MMKTYAAHIALTILVLCSIAPFASRAVYMDEHQYLHVAKFAAEKNWLFPQDTEWVFFGKHYANMAAQTHPPVGEYYLAFLFKLLGHFDEIKFRLLYSVFPVMAILAFYRLARRFTDNPLLVAALFAVSPAFFVMSPSLMMDMPMLAFVLMGLSYYFDYVDGKWARLWPVSVLFILAAGSGYMALVPIGCLLIWSIVRGRPKNEWLALIAAPSAVLVWLLILKLHFGENVVFRWTDYLSAHFSFRRNLLPMLSFIGGVGVFPWMFAAVADSGQRKAIALWSISAAIFFSFFNDWSSLGYRLWFVFLASSGVAWLILFGIRAKRAIAEKSSRAWGFLILCLPAMLIFLLMVADMVCSRYLLLVLPSLFLLAFRHARRRALWTAFFATAALSTSIAIADFRFVNSYREWVSQAAVPLQKQGFRFWSVTESGLRYYLEQKGIPVLETSDLRPRGGDLIVKQSSFNYSLPSELESLLLVVRQKDLPDAFPLRTFSMKAGAGFHDSHLGIVPYRFSRAPLDRIEIVEVSPFVETLPQMIPPDFSLVPVWFPGGVLLKQVKQEMKFSIRFPADSNVEYELEGKADVKISREGITLTNLGPAPAIWKNFRIIPNSWPVE
jgi:hypothetical protein